MIKVNNVHDLIIDEVNGSAHVNDDSKEAGHSVIGNYQLDSCCIVLS